MPYIKDWQWREIHEHSVLMAKTLRQLARRVEVLEQREEARRYLPHAQPIRPAEAFAEKLEDHKASPAWRSHP